MVVQSHGYAAHDDKSPLVPFAFERKDVGENDVLIDIKFCGMCHSDLHQIRNEWGGSKFPMVPGHEIVGKVEKIGANVKKFKVGDSVGVGCMVNSCRNCETCKDDEEQFCKKTVYTYNSKDETGALHQGGYSNNIVVAEHFVVKVDPRLEKNLAGVAPLLCAGITTYSPLKHWKAEKGQSVGVVGLGGLGHMAIKFAHSFGCKVVLFTHSESKVADAKRLGADEVCVTKDKENFKKYAGALHLIIDTVSAEHDLAIYLSCLRKDSSLVLVGLPEKASPLPAFALGGRKSITFSSIGGMAETQEMLDYCAEHDILSDIEVIPIQKVNEAMERMHKSDVKYRFVIDLSTNSKI